MTNSYMMRLACQGKDQDIKKAGMAK